MVLMGHHLESGLSALVKLGLAKKAAGDLLVAAGLAEAVEEVEEVEVEGVDTKLPVSYVLRPL